MLDESVLTQQRQRPGFSGNYHIQRIRGPKRNTDHDTFQSEKWNFYNFPEITSHTGGSTFSHHSTSVEKKIEAESKLEIMTPAEVYFRPLSRYRELQQKKRNSSNLFKSNKFFYSGGKALPQYCLSTSSGLVCFYRTWIRAIDLIVTRLLIGSQKLKPTPDKKIGITDFFTFTNNNKIIRFSVFYYEGCPKSLTSYFFKNRKIMLERYPAVVI